MNPIEKQETIDNEHMKLLAIFHYVSGAKTIAFSSMFIFHLAILGFIAQNPDFFPQRVEGAERAKMAELTGTFMSIAIPILGAFILLGISYGICEIIAGRFISRRRHRMFRFIVAIPRAALFPYGSILSVLTFIVLSRSSVKEQYAIAMEA